jgi:hypothetical protein
MRALSRFLRGREASGLPNVDAGRGVLLHRGRGGGRDYVLDQGQGFEFLFYSARFTTDQEEESG